MSISHFVVLSVTGKKGLEYILDVLGHGGCNTFPGQTGTCPNCQTVVATNEVDVPCPICGESVVFSGHVSYSEWSRQHPNNPTGGCKFIDDAAKAAREGS